MTALVGLQVMRTKTSYGLYPPLPFRILSTKLLLTFDTRDSSESAFSIQPEAVNLHLYQQTMVEAEVQ